MTGKANTGFTNVAFIVLVAAAPSRIVAGEKSPSDAAFERLKSLVGTWEGVEKGSKRPTAYTSNESGREEVYVRSSPAADQQHQVSTAGGTGAVSSGAARRIIYADGRRIVAVDVTGAPTLHSLPSDLRNR
jgi:hypothetical protein